MRKYKVMWSKAYYASGTIEVEAEHEDDAHDKVAYDLIGDLEGSMQYDPDGDEVVVIDEPVKWQASKKHPYGVERA